MEVFKSSESMLQLIKEAKTEIKQEISHDIPVRKQGKTHGDFVTDGAKSLSEDESDILRSIASDCR